MNNCFCDYNINNIELIEFAKNLSIMLEAGIPLITALSDIGENMPREKFKRVIADVILIRTFLKNFCSTLSPVVLYHSTLNPKELLKALVKLIIKEQDTVSDKELDKIELSNILKEEFHRRKLAGTKNLIIIDEAQDLPEHLQR